MIDTAEIWDRVRAGAAMPDGMLSAFAVGSYARGWANTGSDVDVAVVCTAQPTDLLTQGVPLDPPTVPFAAWHDDELRFEVKFWDVRQVEQMAAKVTWQVFEQDPLAGQKLFEMEELFLERMISALPLAGTDWLGEMRARLEASALRTLLTSRSLGYADAAVLDALGQAEVDDLTSAVLSARSAFGYVVDALLEAAGNYGSLAPKWRARRVAEADLADLSFEDYWARETMADFDADNPRDWVMDTVKRTRSLMLRVEL